MKMIWRIVLVVSIISVLVALAAHHISETDYSQRDVVSTLPPGVRLLCYDKTTGDTWAGRYDGQTYVCNPKDSPRYH